MRPKKTTRFDTALLCILWITLCIFTGVALTDSALAAGKKRAGKNRLVAPNSVIQPPPPGGCTAINAQVIVSAVDQPNDHRFTINSNVLCGGGINANSQCPYFHDWTLYYLWGGIWWPMWTSTQQYFDTCGQRDARSFDVPTGVGTYNIQIHSYAGESTNGTNSSLGTTGGTFTFQR
jgi:hypothetical protein